MSRRELPTTLPPGRKPEKVLIAWATYWKDYLGGVHQIWRHKKTGGRYRVIDFSVLQVTSKDDLAICVTYLNEGGAAFSRPVRDFIDRFSEIERALE